MAFEPEPRLIPPLIEPNLALDQIGPTEPAVIFNDLTN